MAKLIVSMMTSLDGFIEGPNRELDWTLEGPEFEEYCDDMMERTDTMVFGRVSYEMMVRYWPAAELEPRSPWELGLARKMNSLPKIVLSRTLEGATWNNTRVVRERVADEVSAVKASATKNVMVFGGAGVIASLRQLGLIDEYRLIVHPIVLGKGTPLFTDVSESFSLRHTKTTRFAMGVDVLYYEPVDAPRPS
jgi:dihydrofolate reductase